MADVENPGPKKEEDELVAAEPSEFVGFACMLMLLLFAIALLAISISLVIFFQNNYPGTKLGHGVVVAGGHRHGCCLDLFMACLVIFREYYPVVGNAKGRGRLS
jgi:hypothetical protein